MKKCYSLLALLLGAGIFVHAQSGISFVSQSEGSIYLTCNLETYTVNTEDIYTSVHLPEGNPILKAGAPDLERLTASVIVDDSREMQITVVHSSYEEFQGIYMRPSKGNLLRTVDPATIPYSEGMPYSTNAFYPGSLASLGDAFVQGQFRGQAVHFQPVQYNPVTHTLRIYSNIEVEITPGENEGLNPLPSTVPAYTNATMREVYSGRFINYAANSNRYDVIDEIGNLLVMGPAEYNEELAPWIQWKKEKGIPTELVNTEGMTLNAINNYVENYYNTNGLTYLVIVGDEDQVPVQMLNNSGGQGYCDACYGYISGNDSYSEVFIGRLLVHNDDELIPVISKILEYEKTPNTVLDWFSVAMGIGSNEGDGFGDDNQADWQHNNGIKEDLLSFTYNSVYERYDGSHGNSSPSGGVTADAAGSPPATSLTSVINDGCSLINYTGHGAHNLIVTGSYNNNNIYALDNHGFYPYFIIVGCCTGDYDDDDAGGDTFGEAWLKSDNTTAPTGGIGGAFSSVYQSWAPPMEGQDEMNRIIADLESYDTRHTLGSIHFHGCAGMNDAYGSQGDEMTDTWHLMGDPTVQLRTAMPVQITATHPATGFFGINQLNVSCNIEGAMIGLTFEGEILASGIISGGQITLSFDPVTGPGSILVTATSFNTIPYQGYVELVPANGPFIVGEANAIDDSAGNNNGLADYNENILIDADAHNIGVNTAVNVTATITSDNASVVIDDNTHNYGDVAAGATTSADGAFAFHVNGYIADMTVVTFTITYTDADGNVWTSPYSVTIHAPAFNCSTSMTIDDASGNNNGRLDSGETVTITVPVTNNGHAATAVAVLVSLTETNSYVTLTSSTADLGILAAGQTAYAEFTASIAADCPASEQIDFNLVVSSDFYGSDCVITRFANLMIEDWESGSDNSFPWEYADESPWFVTSSTFYEGSYSMQSGEISDNQESTMLVDMSFATQTEVSFMYKTSTENGYDKLRFRIDGIEQTNWSGENDWTMATYTVNAGNHTFLWTYDKDFTATDGEDACWVDNIIFTPETASGVRDEASASTTLQVYPNPASGEAAILLNLSENDEVSVTVQDLPGAIVYRKESWNVAAGSNRQELDCRSWAPGVYIVSIHSARGDQSIKFIKQ